MKPHTAKALRIVRDLVDDCPEDQFELFDRLTEALDALEAAADLLGVKEVDDDE